MSTRPLIGGYTHSFDVLFKDLFKDSNFVPATDTKLPHPVDIYELSDGIVFEVACTGIDKEDVKISTENRDTLKITYDKPKLNESDSEKPSYIYKGISKKSFNLAYKIASKYDLSLVKASLENGLLKISIPYAEEAKPATIKIS